MTFFWLLTDAPPATDLVATINGLKKVPLPVWGAVVSFLGALRSVSDETGWSLGRRASATVFGSVGGWVLTFALCESLNLHVWAMPLYFYLGSMGYGLSGGSKAISRNFQADWLGTIKQLILLRKDVLSEKLGVAPLAGPDDQPDGGVRP